MSTCKRGHVDPPRYPGNGWCKVCARERNQLARVRDYKRKYNVTRYATRKDEMLQRHRVYRETVEGRATTLLGNSERRAVEKGATHSLTLEWLRDRLRVGVCEASGVTLMLSHLRGPLSPSIDRIDSSKGYDPENCRLIAWSLNAAFGKWGEDAFEEVAEAWLRKRRGE